MGLMGLRSCKKSVRTYTHTEFLFTYLNLRISLASHLMSSNRDWELGYFFPVRTST
jgi:hypothetical protein